MTPPQNNLNCDTHEIRIEKLEDTVKDHEARIRPLEGFAAKIGGMALVGSVLGSILAKVVLQ